MAKKKLKRRKPKPQPEPEAKNDSSMLVSKGSKGRKGKVARLQPENEKWFPVFESVAATKEFKKIKGSLTKTKRVSGGG